MSNSRTQRAYIEEQAAAAKLSNVHVLTADLNDFQAPRQYDRIIAIECFEHMKNYKELLRRVSTWLKPDGRFFCHTFCHKTLPYHFEVCTKLTECALYFAVRQAIACQ